ncbi:Chorismate mutase I [Novosphingobium sp. 9U]|nr:Chorismate mutase I [Novosphingobium sp. 9U]
MASAKAASGIARATMLAARPMSEPASSPEPALKSAADPVLAGYRASIDNIDAALIHMLAERFRITQAVGAYKAQTSLPASDPGREERQIARLRKLAEEAQLDPDFGEKFLRFIIDEVIRHHERAKAGV